MIKLRQQKFVKYHTKKKFDFTNVIIFKQCHGVDRFRFDLVENTSHTLLGKVTCSNPAVHRLKVIAKNGGRLSPPPPGCRVSHPSS